LAPEGLPAHLTMNYRVLDQGNRVLAEGRDLAALRRQLGGQASESLRQAAATGEREDIVGWDFGDLPERVEIKSGGRPIAAFPSLVEEAGGLKLRLLDSPAPAREKHRRGVCRLAWQVFPDLLKQTERDLAQRLKGAALLYLMLDKSLTAEALTREVLYAAARARPAHGSSRPAPPDRLRKRGPDRAGPASPTPRGRPRVWPPNAWTMPTA
jgi:ATP-dependent helicase HrpA